MIPKNLLTAKGTIEGILALSSNEDQTFDLEKVTDHMDVASSTARERLNALGDAGVVRQTAELVDDEPTRVFHLTESGEELAEHLEAVIE